jgi:hypothetical protein
MVTDSNGISQRRVCTVRSDSPAGELLVEHLRVAQPERRQRPAVRVKSGAVAWIAPKKNAIISAFGSAPNAPTTTRLPGRVTRASSASPPARSGNIVTLFKALWARPAI